MSETFSFYFFGHFHIFTFWHPCANLLAVHVFQDKVISFIYDAYHDQSGNLKVPELLKMKKDVSNHREILELKGYRTKNRYTCKNTETCGFYHLSHLY